MRNHKKIKSIRQKFGIVGYAIWVMMLEHLTGNDGNVFENSELELELMSGDFGVSVTEISDVLSYCIKLELLFSVDGFIKSESLDERLAPVYVKRGLAKSKSKQQQRSNGKFATNNADGDGQSVTETPQSRVEESKLDESSGIPTLKELLTLFEGHPKLQKFPLVQRRESAEKFFIKKLNGSKGDEWKDDMELWIIGEKPKKGNSENTIEPSRKRTEL